MSGNRSFKTDLKMSDVTPKANYLNRRQLMAGGSAALGCATLPGKGLALGPYDTTDKPNSLEEITSYTNFYEFGFSKTSAPRLAHKLTTDPWAIEIGGLVERPGTYDLSDILMGKAIEERIYRLRCVETWSMVVPWHGFELNQLLDQVGVLPRAKYVAFETLVRPEEMPEQKRDRLDWPSREGLRLDEAMHPLTILATGLYGDDLPKQNGAPIRLVVPWKYGFKSIKSIVKITLTAMQPPTTWNNLQPDEYGFYANVNPDVSHKRWSQASERRIGGGLFARRRTTLMFNGYEEYVADLYAGMDLAKYY